MPQPPPPPVSPEVVNAVVGAYYQSMVSGAETVRKRGEFAYTVAAAIAAALVTAGAFADLGDRPLAVQILAALALVGWLTAATLFVHAVAAPVRQPELPNQVVGAAAFVRAIRDAVARERTELNTRQARARWVAVAAALVTVAAVGSGVFFEPAQDDRRGRLVLTQPGIEHVQSVCSLPVEGPAIEGDVASSSLVDDDPGLRVRLAAGTCEEAEVDAALDPEDVEVYVLLTD